MSDQPRTTETPAKTGDLSDTTPAEGDSLAAEQAGDEDFDGDLSEMTNDELRDRLADRDLPTSGVKEELIERLQADSKSAPASGEVYPPTGSKPFNDFRRG